MYLIFGYQREVPVKIEGKTSKITLVILGILVVLLSIFLSFENLDEETSIPASTFEASHSLDRSNDPAEVEGTRFEEHRIYPALRSFTSSPAKGEMSREDLRV
jgi:hypothetical protein